MREEIRPQPGSIHVKRLSMPELRKKSQGASEKSEVKPGTLERKSVKQAKPGTLETKKSVEVMPGTETREDEKVVVPGTLEVKEELLGPEVPGDVEVLPGTLEMTGSMEAEEEEKMEEHLLVLVFLGVEPGAFNSTVSKKRPCN